MAISKHCIQQESMEHWLCLIKLCSTHTIIFSTHTSVGAFETFDVHNVIRSTWMVCACKMCLCIR